MSSSDGQRFPVRVKARNAAYIPKYFGYGRILTLYTWTSDQHSQWRCKPEPSYLRDATFILDGLVDNETILPLHEHTSDTAGYTDRIFGLYDLLGFQFSPRIRDLKDQQIYYHRNNSELPHIKELIQGKVKPSVIESHWDNLLRVAASMKMGWMAPSLFISKIQAQPRQSQLSKALLKYGRLIKSIYIPKYICSAEQQRRVSIQLNKGEALHDLRRWTFRDSGAVVTAQSK